MYQFSNHNETFILAYCMSPETCMEVACMEEGVLEISDQEILHKTKYIIKKVDLPLVQIKLSIISSESNTKEEI